MLHKYKCRCGQEIFSQSTITPPPISWTDGHVCAFEPVETEVGKMTDEMKARIKSMANRTWQAIGADCLVDDYGNPDEAKVLPRDHVIELVGDADRMLYYGEDREAYDVYQALPSWEDKQQILREAFQLPAYGW